jgi:hypothetical protein
MKKAKSVSFKDQEHLSPNISDNCESEQSEIDFSKIQLHE